MPLLHIPAKYKPSRKSMKAMPCAPILQFRAACTMAFTINIALGSSDDVTEELFLNTLVTEFDNAVGDMVTAACASYLKQAVPERVRKSMSDQYERFSSVRVVLNGKHQAVMIRDCSAQFLVLLLEQCAPETFVQLMSESQSLRLDLLWAFFGQPHPVKLHQSWVSTTAAPGGHTDIHPANRGSASYNIAMRSKLTAAAVFTMNAARGPARYSSSGAFQFAAYILPYQSRVDDDIHASDQTFLTCMAIDKLLTSEPDIFLQLLIHRVNNATSYDPLHQTPYLTVAKLCTCEALQAIITKRARCMLGENNIPFLFYELIQVIQTVKYYQLL